MKGACRKADRPIVAAAIAALLFAVLGTYVGGYFATSEFREATVLTSSGRPIYWRVFDQDWQARLYSPAIRIESMIRGNRVVEISPRDRLDSPFD